MQLVTYFSASGTTAKLANRLAEAIDAALYEIRPKVPYTQSDLDWTNRKSRSTVEMQDENARPALADRKAPIDRADTIFVGFPIWWYREPSIIDTFLEAYDFTGKKIVPFATSGGSDLGDTAKRMQAIVGEGATVLPGKRFRSNADKTELKAWAEA